MDDDPAEAFGPTPEIAMLNLLTQFVNEAGSLTFDQAAEFIPGLETLSKEDRARKFFRDNPDQIKKGDMLAIAKALGIGKSTLYRIRGEFL